MLLWCQKCVLKCIIWCISGMREIQKKSVSDGVNNARTCVESLHEHLPHLPSTLFIIPQIIHAKGLICLINSDKSSEMGSDRIMGLYWLTDATLATNIRHTRNYLASTIVDDIVSDLFKHLYRQYHMIFILWLLWHIVMPLLGTWGSWSFTTGVLGSDILG